MRVKARIGEEGNALNGGERSSFSSALFYIHITMRIDETDILDRVNVMHTLIDATTTIDASTIGAFEGIQCKWNDHKMRVVMVESK